MIQNPSLKDLERSLEEAQAELATLTLSGNDKQRVITKIRMLRSAIQALREYRAFFS